MKTTISADCSKCGKGKGYINESGDIRCGKCGRFANFAENYCHEHGFDGDKNPIHDKCPVCAQKRHFEQQRQEQMERRANPRMHTTIDAPRF